MATVAIIGRTEILYNTALKALENGHQIPLIITSKEAPEYTRTSKDFEQLAHSIGATYIYTPKINTPEVIAKIKDIPLIDIAISINYSGIISQKVIDLFSIGILNAHGGDLPRYRGNACQAWALINGEDKIGLCVHKMIGNELDSGDIIARQYLPVNIDTRVGTVWDWMEQTTSQLMLTSLEKLTKDPSYILEAQSKNPKDALRCYPRNPDDGKIDWTQSSVDILRLINASSEPYAGAFCEFNGEKLIIWRAKIHEDNEVYLAVPGQVAAIDHNTGQIIVITGQGKLLIEEVEYQHQRTVPAQFIKSIRKRLK